MPFDDTVVNEDLVTDEKFYDLFEPVFKRNARFAKKKPVPNMGDKDTPMSEVYKFYRYWDNFETWREWGQFEEYDPKEASDRYERRYMEKENKRVSDKHVKKERKRLIGLVEMAYKNDPRVKLVRQEEE